MALLYRITYYLIKGVCIPIGKNPTQSKWLFWNGQAGLTINYFNVKVTTSELLKDTSDPLPWGTFYWGTSPLNPVSLALLVTS